MHLMRTADQRLLTGRHRMREGSPETDIYVGIGLDLDHLHVILEGSGLCNQTSRT